MLAGGLEGMACWQEGCRGWDVGRRAVGDGMLAGGL